MKKMIHILCLLAMHGHIIIGMDQPQKLLSLKPTGMGDFMKHFYNVPPEVAQLLSDLQEIIITKKKHPRFLYPKISCDCGSLVKSVAFSCDGRVAIACSKKVRIFNPTTWRCIQQLYHGDYVNAVVFLSDGKLATGSSDKKVRIFDTTTWQCIKVLDHGDDVDEVTFSSDGKLATVSCDKKTRIFDTTTWECTQELNNADWIRSLAFSSDGKLATGNDSGKVRIFDPTTWQCIQELDHDGWWIRSVAFSSNGKLATGSGDGIVRVFDTTTWQCTQKLDQGNHVNAMAFSSDDKLGTGSGHGITGIVRIFDTTTWQCIQELDYDYCIESIAFSSDGKQLATGSEGKVRFFEWYTPYTWHEGLLLRIIFIWLNVAKHSQEIKNFDLMLADIAKIFCLTKDVESSLCTAWERFSVQLRDFIWNKSYRIIRTYGKM